MKFEYNGYEFEIHVQKVSGLGWCWVVTLDGRSLRNTMNEDGRRSADRAYASARQWIRNNA